MSEWVEEEVSISTINKLLNDGYEVEVTSPDGWVGVNFFIDKGYWDEYILICDGQELVRCNANHLFETTVGWVSAAQLEDSGVGAHILMSDGMYKMCKIIKTSNRIPIVDINVNHDNHRYYTNGVSSHNTGVGKSLFMCHCASANMMSGLNVLYITLEMAEERIAERIDANLLDTPIDQLAALPKDIYDKKVAKIRSKTVGKLIVKEYPTASAGSANFRHLLNELKIKKNFMPDIIYIDYLNICMSSRIKYGANVNSYTLIKAIAEELRGLAVEYNVPIVSATQTTRSGYCLSLDTQVFVNNQKTNIIDVKVGDRIDTFGGQNIVKTVFPITKKKAYKITLANGKTIICSKEHMFPTKDGEKSIKKGLKVGEYLQVKHQ
jgi:hypothetical protein